MSSELLTLLRRRIARLETRSPAQAGARPTFAPRAPLPIAALPGARDERPVRFHTRHRVEVPTADGARPLHGQPFDPAGALYLDTETTGLSVGAGTLPFLIGMGWFDHGEFVVEQLLMRGPEEEAGALAALAARVARASGIVTYNGATFDLPLLESRFVLKRMRPPHATLPHLDLLGPSRRMFRARLLNCRLVSVEEHVLGLRRDGDVAGALIPGLYVHYLRTGDAAQLHAVVDHNRQDVVSMPHLLAALARKAQDPLLWADGAEELVAIGRMQERAGDAALAEACLAQAVNIAVGPEPRRRALLALAACLRRRRAHDDLQRLWERYAREFPDDNTGWVELAKHHEHRRRDLPSALAAAAAAPRRTADVSWRIERIQRRMGEAAATSA